MNKRTGKWYAESNQKPTRVNGQIASRTCFYRRELRKIVKSRFKLTLPNYEWDLDYILNTLIMRGYIIISKTPTAGVLPIWGSLSGYNYIGLPTKAIMTSPILGDWENTIGTDCEIVYLERNENRSYYNFQEITNITAQKLASADATIDINLINSRLSYMAEAETKAQAETIKAMYDEVSEGNPLVVYRKDTLSKTGGGLSVFFGNVKQNYVADMIQDTKRTIMNEFLTSLGINNANTDKRERLVTNEVDANNIELRANTDIWEYNLERQCEKIDSIFPGLGFNIELNEDLNMIGGMLNAITQYDRNVGNTKSG